MGGGRCSDRISGFFCLPETQEIIDRMWPARHTHRRWGECTKMSIYQRTSHGTPGWLACICPTAVGIWTRDGRTIGTLCRRLSPRKSISADLTRSRTAGIFSSMSTLVLDLEEHWEARIYGKNSPRIAVFRHHRTDDRRTLPPCLGG